MSARTSRPRGTPAPGRLRTVTPEAFEHWTGERFEGLGYAVLRTPFRGDHGIDLNVERQGERAIVQCKHWPAGAVGEPVLRDLYGTLTHVGAQAAYLVTTGSATPAAREWAKDKPIHIWDWQYLIGKWPAEIDELAARTSAAAASSSVRPGWYVYFDDLNAPWAIKLSKAVGEHPLLGFEPLCGMPVSSMDERVRGIFETCDCTFAEGNTVTPRQVRILPGDPPRPRS